MTILTLLIVVGLPEAQFNLPRPNLTRTVEKPIESEVVVSKSEQTTELKERVSPKYSAPVKRVFSTYQRDCFS